MIIGPTGRSERCVVTIPSVHARPPKILLRTAYCRRERLTFLLDAAGIATRAAVISPPMMRTPSATTNAMQAR